MTINDTGKYITSAKYTQTWKRRITALLPLLSLLVTVIVFWWLKLTGITLTGEAFCGYTEHSHSEQCILSELICTEQEHEHTEDCYRISYTCDTEEHVHTSSCYSDVTADLETAEIWEATLPELTAEMTAAERIIEIARSQLGYTESQLNFTVDADKVKHGYTRYGEWYGNPYGDWSVMFTSFCLRYAGLTEVPISSGANAMLLSWETEGIYRTSDTYTPLPGDIVFLDKNNTGAPNAAAIITAVGTDAITVIEGNLDDCVAEASYALNDSAIAGYGLLSPENSLTVVGESDFSTFATAIADTVFIAKTTEFDHSLFTDTNSFVVYTAGANGYYAFDGDGNAVQIFIDGEGIITANVDDPNILLWTFTQSGGETSYLIKNVSTGRYMHAYPNNGTGVTTAGAYTSTLISDGNAIKIRSNTEYAYLNESAGIFQMTQAQSGAAAYQFGIVSNCAVWLDGTNGGLKCFRGSLDKCYIVSAGSTIQLPSAWQSPSNYGYALRGWYDITNSVYYRPGDVVTVNGNTVMYADWIPADLDIGKFNAYVCNTVSSNHIITTRVFEFNSLFNVLSSAASVTVNASGHSEVWSHVASGTVPYKNAESLDFVFVDNDSSGRLSMASNRNANNRYDANIQVKPNIYTPELGEVLFGTDNGFDPETETGILGKTYMGSGDHLFQYMDDPNSKYYGYYYYDSDLHAASFNYSEQRFYVYDYLERTSDSANASGTQKYSDFLPLNSPYANTAGKSTDFYTYDGVLGEYEGVTHYQYDVSQSSENTVSTNMGFGISMEMNFYLPDVPGTVGADGDYGNKDLYGNYMSYTFSGDDDVWVLVDGAVRLDIGGIHGIVSGEINFSSGIVTVDGEQTGTLYDIEPGEHTLTIYYLERGSSQSNCAMYFNVAPRFSLDIQKEDVLTQELLDGAEFSVYTDPECTVGAELWNSEADYNNQQPPTNVFTVTGGHAYMWGMSPGKTYYIKETKPPDADGYNLAKGIIYLTFDIKGQATFDIQIAPEDADSSISAGYTAYGYLIDTENQAAYVTVTNAQEWVTDITSARAVKVWNDTLDHSEDYVTVYLTITDPDGTVRRIREAILGEENDWTYAWTNLPMYAADGVTEIDYGIEESYTQGYSSSVERATKITVDNSVWEEAYTFVDGEKYLLLTSNGYLSASSSSAQTLTWVDEKTAKGEYKDEYSLSAWTASVSGSNVRFTNSNGQILSFNNGISTNSRYFFVTKSSTSYQSLVFSESGSGITLHYRRSSRNLYYMSELNSSGYASSSTRSTSALIFTPMILRTELTETEVSGILYKITNTPLKSETSFKVTKHWDTGLAVNVPYETSQVTIRLYANGKDTGRTVTLNLKNGWTDTFRGLPYTDDNGVEIVYSIEEVWSSDDWETFYGEIVRTDGDIPAYEATVTNVYRFGHGYELPSTGGRGQTVWILSGLAIMLSSLVFEYIIRRNSGRRARR